MLKTYVLPAYQQLIKTVVELKDSSKNEEGLCYLPNGKEYYELTVQASTGSVRTVPQLQKLTKNQMKDDLAAMKAVIGLTAEQAKETAVMESTDPKEILNSLSLDIQKTFPKLPQTSVEVKYVPKAMEAHLSPAFYMIPALDDTKENVIYVNQAQMGNKLTLYTTLAHEGYPGHLYQTVYYASTKPDPDVYKRQDMMSVQAQNALLKTIEEPPAYAVILLLTENAEILLPTIRSRCVMLKLRNIKDQLIKKYLMEMCIRDSIQ